VRKVLVGSTASLPNPAGHDRPAGLAPEGLDQEALRPSLRYLRRVASPPRMCRSALLRSKMRFTLRAKSLLTRGSRSVTSLWTVLLLTPKTAAAWRTVALDSTM